MNQRTTLPLWAWGAIVLLLVCLSRISIDIYLPSLPAMADALHASDAQLQLTLSLFMAGSAASMLACGPLADRYGRRPVLLAGTGIFVLASIVCTVTSDVYVLIGARVLQAFGGCSGTIIGRVMVRDRFDPATQARMLGKISMAMGLSPIVAPLAGSVLDAAFGWRAVFGVLCLLGALSLGLIAAYVPETKPASVVPQGNTLALYRRQLQRWLQLLLYARQQDDGKIHALLPLAAVRAAQMEALCQLRGGDRDAQDLAFMTGVFSLLDVLLGMPMEEIIATLNLAPEVSAALLERNGELGALLALVESSAPSPDGLRRAGIDGETYWRSLLQAYQWAIQVSRNL